MTTENYDKVMSLCMWVGIIAILLYYTMVVLKLVAYERLQPGETPPGTAAQRVPVETEEATEAGPAEASMAQATQAEATHEVYTGVGGE